ncbi:MAG: A/G-specific adenine glycosylase [Bdellovibrionales bacterium]|nr:A/G-specific adenine glycosylase [Bdellovibrionales bacterium]
MLQQTTVKAVIPYFLKFMERFPDLKSLADADISEVYQYWSGLGYYSRARNLLKAAQAMRASGGFPKGYLELLELPGFGPYTSRAVSSQAFSERVGVVDGNVIRVLSRILGKPIEAWTDAGRTVLQNAADALVAEGDPSAINQALMELGATICTPAGPACMLCPVRADCVAFKEGTWSRLPLKKPRRLMEIWQWTVFLPPTKLKPNAPRKKLSEDKSIPLQKNDYAPFLKGTLIFPGTVHKLSKKPKTAVATHTVTHHKIYISVKTLSALELKSLKARKDVQWVSPNKLTETSPHKILQKAISAQSQTRI